MLSHWLSRYYLTVVNKFPIFLSHQKIVNLTCIQSTTMLNQKILLLVATRVDYSHIKCLCNFEEGCCIHILLTVPYPCPLCDQSERFKYTCLGLGSIHAWLNFVAAIGSVVTESGQSDIISEIHGGGQKLLSGKQFPRISGT